MRRENRPHGDLCFRVPILREATFNVALSSLRFALYPLNLGPVMKQTDRLLGEHEWNIMILDERVVDRVVELFYDGS